MANALVDQLVDILAPIMSADDEYNQLQSNSPG